MVRFGVNKTGACLTKLAFSSLSLVGTFHGSFTRWPSAVGQKLELCSGSRIRGCDLMSSVKNCTASYLQRHANTNVCRKITDRAKSEHYVGPMMVQIFSCGSVTLLILEFIWIERATNFVPLYIRVEQGVNIPTTSALEDCKCGPVSFDLQLSETTFESL